MIFLNKKARMQRSAEKFVAQGKTAQAIEEYQKLVTQDPKDLMAINMLGDLYIRAGRVEDAVHNFTRIAEHYRENGYTVKAIAMYKKISKINPADADVSGKLAVLYSQQGLIVEARQQYLTIADMHAKNNDIQGAFEIYQKIADLEPENTDIRVKLGELCLRIGQTRKAHDCFVAAGQELGRRGRFEDSLNSYLRALAADKTSRHALQAVSAIYVHIGEPMKAVDLLNRAFEDRPGDIDLLTILGKTYLAAEMLDEAEATLLSLIQMDPGKHEYLIELGRKFLQKNLYDRAAEQVDGCIDILISRRNEEKAVALLHEVLKKDLNHIPSLERLVDIYTRVREMHSMLSTLDWLAEAAVRMGAKDTAVRALRRLADLDRHNEEYRRRLRDLGVEVDDALSIGINQNQAQQQKGSPIVEFQSPDSSGPVTHGMTELGKELESIDFFIEQEFLEIAREALDRLSQRFPDEPKVQLRYDRLNELVMALGEKSNEFDTYGTPGSATPSFDAPHTDLPRASFSSAAEFDMDVPPPPPSIPAKHQETVVPDGGFAMFDSQNGSSSFFATEKHNVQPEMDLPEPTFVPPDVFAPIVENSKTAPPPAEPTFAFSETPAQSEEPSGFNFFSDTGSMGGSSVLEPEPVVERFVVPEKPEVKQTVSAPPPPMEISWDGSTGATTDDEDLDTVINATIDAMNNLGGALPKPSAPVQPAAPVQSTIVTEPAQNQFETEFTLDQSSFEMPEVAKSNDKSPLISSDTLKSANQSTTTKPGGQKVMEMEMLDPISSHQGILRIQDAGTSDLFDFNFNDEEQKSGVDASLLEVFDEFRKSLAAEGPPDFETHYQLGIAYKEMMLWDEALKEFQIAIKATTNDDPTGRYLQCCNMLGQCFMSKQLPRPASLWFKKGLDSPNRSEEEYQALRYELGLALEQQGDLGRAYEVFQEVCAVDLGYRAVDRKLEELHSRMVN